jgi:hypothetical protein
LIVTARSVLIRARLPFQTLHNRLFRRVQELWITPRIAPNDESLSGEDCQNQKQVLLIHDSCLGVTSTRATSSDRALCFFRATLSRAPLTHYPKDMSNHPNKRKREIAAIVSAIVNYPEGGIEVELDRKLTNDPNCKTITIRWRTSMNTPPEKWQEAKAKLEQMFPGWRFSYS